MDSANDNAPTFASQSVSISLKETQPVGSIVYIAAALDFDAGLNGVMSYNLVDPSLTFLINSNTGLLTLNKLLIYEQRSVYNLTITAQDRGTTPLSTNMSIIVNVIDTNDFTPKFNQQAYVFNVSENVALGSQCGAVLAKDANRGRNGFVTYAIKPSLLSQKFGINSLTGIIFTNVTLDYERRKQYNLSVIAKDGGSPAKSSVVPVTINIINENDNRPLLSNSTYVFTVPENLLPQSHVGFVFAQDNDPNADLAYSLLASSTPFKIDRSSGEIMTNSFLDREKLSEYVLTVKVSDSIHSVSATVSVLLSDVNDNSPTFTQSGVYTAYVYENLPIGTVILKIIATDPDAGVNGTVTYSIDQGTSIIILF